MTAHKVALIEFYAFNFGAIMGPNVGALKFHHTHTCTHTHTQRETIHTHTHKETDISTWQAQKPIKLICQTLKRRLSTFMFTNPWHICANGYIPDSVCVCVSVCVMSLCAQVCVRVSCHYQGFLFDWLEEQRERTGSVQKGLRATKCVARRKVKAAKEPREATAAQQSEIIYAPLQERWSIKWY